MRTKIFFASILVAAVTLASCEKAVEEHVYSKLTPELAFTSGENAQAATDEMYESLHSAFRTPYFYVNDMATDVCYRSGKPFETLNDNEIMTSSENEHFWTDIYKVAARANIVLDNVPGMEESLFAGVSTQAQMLAEAHFMRAFAYYNLTDAYYQVPLVTSSTDDIFEASGFATIDEIEKVIEEDLVAAIPVLPKTYDNTQAQRPTTGAAMAYLCRLYMRQAGRLRNDGQDATDKWNKALEQVNKVLALEGEVYTLLPEVFDIYVANTLEGKYNKEIIFAIRSIENNDIESGSWDIGLSWTPWDCNYGWSTFSMPLELAWSFQEGDSRFASNMVFTTYTRYQRTDKDKYKNCIFFFPPSIEKVGLMIKEFQEANPDVSLESKSAENDAVYTRKYEYYEAGSYNYNTPNNAITCRLADMILCKAEILNELGGPSDEAVALLNRVRERAFQGTDHNYVKADFSGKDAFRSALCDERAWEFHSEGLRRPDLIRMGLWKDRMTKYISAIKEKAGWKEKNEGREAGYYKGMYTAYPTTLQEKDPLMYMPVPHRELSINPDLANARTF